MVSRSRKAVKESWTLYQTIYERLRECCECEDLYKSYELSRKQLADKELIKAINKEKKYYKKQIIEIGIFD
jgi:hypothetical protein